jgi:hypothetical protein
LVVKKGLNILSRCSGANSATGVADLDPNQTVDFRDPGFDRQGAALGHRLGGIENQVDKDLFHLIGVEKNIWLQRVIVPDDPDIEKKCLMLHQRRESYPSAD